MTGKKGYQVTLTVLAVALALTAGIAARSMHREKQMRAYLEEVYRGAVLSALRQMEDVSVNLNKALLSGDPEAADKYLGRVSSGAAQVQRSLSLLPLSHPMNGNAVKFANQASDYAAMLLEKGVTDEDARQLEALVNACIQYTAALYRAREELPLQAAEQKTFYDAAPEGEGGGYDSGVSYPTLIYDGPFSDARDTAERAKALGDRVIDKEEALRIAREFVGDDRVVSVSPGADTGGSIPCWGVTLQLQGLTLQAAVTQQGGKILWMTPDTAAFPVYKSMEECRENALTFLRRSGYEDMRATYFQAYEGVMVISFAATQGDTLLYPDLVKVQLRMDTAQVVGIEARNYLTHHAPRGLLTPEISLEEAEGAVSGELDIDRAQLCLIPTDGGEKLCYEFHGVYRGNTYLCYINAQNGKQEQLLQVIESDTGLEAV